MPKTLLSFHEFLKEAYAMDGDAGAADGIEYEPQHREALKTRKKRQEEEQAQKMKPQPQHGFMLSPEHETAISSLLQQEYDDPDTMEVETPKSASWQEVNVASQNAVQRQLQKLKAQQGMGQ